MMRPRASLLMGTVYRGEYVVDPLAVADAILKRRGARTRRSQVLETSQSGPDGAVGTHERNAAPEPDAA